MGAAARASNQASARTSLVRVAVGGEHRIDHELMGDWAEQILGDEIIRRKRRRAHGGAGDVHLLLSRDDLVYIDTGLDYTYYVQPTLFTDVAPEGGPKRGGTMTTLTG